MRRLSLNKVERFYLSMAVSNTLRLKEGCQRQSYPSSASVRFNPS